MFIKMQTLQNHVKVEIPHSPLLGHTHTHVPTNIHLHITLCPLLFALTHTTFLMLSDLSHSF